MNKISMFGIVALGIGILFSNLSNNAIAQVNVQGMKQINEDQIIICVNKENPNHNQGFVCHIFNIDDIDWYQETSENNYGKFGDLRDSFDVSIED